MSYYAVQGHGIVRSWAECQPLVHRKNLKYKKFSSETDAQAFLASLAAPVAKRDRSDESRTNASGGYDPSKRVKTNAEISAEQESAAREADARLAAEKARAADPTLLDFYTDGSHIKGTPHMGFGIYCCYHGIKYGAHQTVTEEWMHDFLSDASGVDLSKLSNPSMEAMAVVALSRHLDKHGAALVKCGIGKITVVHDYNGVSEWITGRWKARQPHIVAIVNEMCRLHERIVRSVPVEFVWTRGHSGVAGNTYADMLAKNESISGLKPLEELFRMFV